MRELEILYQSPGLNVVHHVDLTEVARPNPTLFVRLEMLAPTAPPDMLDWCAIRSVRFTTPWPAEFTRDLPKQEVDAEELGFVFLPLVLMPPTMADALMLAQPGLIFAPMARALEPAVRSRTGAGAPRTSLVRGV